MGDMWANAPTVTQTEPKRVPRGNSIKIHPLWVEVGDICAKLLNYKNRRYELKHSHIMHIPSSRLTLAKTVSQCQKMIIIEQTLAQSPIIILTVNSANSEPTMFVLRAQFTMNF